jgi:ribosomal protein S18 acetylase RimI-like enzyme
MPVIQPMPWDSRQLGLPVGRLMDFTVGCMDQSLADYGLVFARVPQHNREAIAKLQTCDFQYIGLDLCLVADPDELGRTDDASWNIRRISHCVPEFQISGFRIEDSRFMLDPACRKRLPMGFWDSVIHEHCSKFADTVIVSVDANNHLAGFISCLMRPAHLNLFMVAVQPGHHGCGLGGALLRDAAALARERAVRLSTSVMASNVRGFNFYLKHNFLVEDGEVVMHRWQEGAHVVT